MSKIRESNSDNRKDLVEIPPSNITKLKLIGTGGFAEVFTGKWDGSEVAIKQLHLKQFTPTLYQDFINEAEILAKCRHPAVVHFFGISVEEHCYQLILEYLPRGSLFQNLSNLDIPMPMVPLRMEIALDVARGLRYLHQIDIIHKDLKSMNVLLTNDWRAKISDFGLAKVKIATEVSSTSTKKAASTRWCAPELFKRNAARTKESDIWSFGMLLWEITSRKIPFAEEGNEMLVMGFIKDGEKETIPNDCPTFLSDIILQCWNIDPKSRPEASKIADAMELQVAELRKAAEKTKVEKEIKKVEQKVQKLEIKEKSSPPIGNPPNIQEFIAEDMIFEKFYGRPEVQPASITNAGKTAKGEVGNVFTNKSFSSGKHRWMVRIDKKKTAITIGIMTKGFETFYIGMEENGWGVKVFSRYLSAYHNQQYRDSYSNETFSDGDKIGVLLDCDKGELSYFRNGVYLGVAHTIPTNRVYVPGVTIYDSEVTIINWE